jgi:polyvinyl alcohol dehydrogenase (cytochrome)
MQRLGKLPIALSIALVAILLIASTALADTTGQWPTAGNDLTNSRYQSGEKTLRTSNVGNLTPKWTFTTAGDVSATPSVDGQNVYFPDWAGYLYAVDRKTGNQVWSVKLSDVTGVANDKARATPAISGNTLVIGTQGSILTQGGGPGGYVLAFDKTTGNLLWKTQVDSNMSAIITQSATIYNGRVYVGVASLEEALAAFVPGYTLSFRGSMVALNLKTGAVIWKTYMIPTAFTGGAVWGSSPAIDTKRNQLYIGTGNNYSVPQAVSDCVTAANGDATATAACLPANDYFDSVLALDLTTGAVKWATRAIPFDAWNGNCLFGSPSLCPQPSGPDYDFGQAPALFTAKIGGKSVDVVGAGQKSGQYWELDANTGAVLFAPPAQAGPGGTAGGLQWGSAVDGKRIYTANANSDLTPWGPSGDTSGVWSAIDPTTNQIIWQTRPPHGGSTSGPVTTANGVVFGCSLDTQGYMYAIDAATGAVLWSFASGGSCLSGAAISNGMLFWGSGYSNFGFGTPNNKVYAFGLP